VHTVQCCRSASFLSTNVVESTTLTWKITVGLRGKCSSIFICPPLQWACNANTNTNVFRGSVGVRIWPKIVPHFHVTGVRFGHIAAAEELNLSVCFLQRRRSFALVELQPLPALGDRDGYVREFTVSSAYLQFNCFAGLMSIGYLIQCSVRSQLPPISRNNELR
jgi:hypothetical protein